MTGLYVKLCAKQILFGTQMHDVVHLSRLTVNERWVQSRVGPSFAGHSAADPLAGSEELASCVLARGAAGKFG